LGTGVISVREGEPDGWRVRADLLVGVRAWGSQAGVQGVELVSLCERGKLHVDIKFYIETGKKYRSLFVP